MARRIAFGCAGTAVLWLVGLFWFSTQIPRYVQDPTTATDAIVVLTGGADRLTTGLRLLDAGQSTMVFVSGVSQGIDVGEILRSLGLASERYACCIELGHEATDTAGNAAETARWMKNRGFRSLRLVTANYHMPRSLAEFQRAMPMVTLVSHPVFPDSVRLEEWWRWPGTASLIASEFTKYVLSQLRPVRIHA